MIFKLLSYPRALFNLFFMPAFTLICSLYALYIVSFKTRKDFENLSRKWAKVICYLSGIKLHVKGKENLKKYPSMILVSNHLALLDIPVLFLALPISFRMAAKAELFKIPLFGAALRASGMLPIARGNPQAAHAVLKQTLEKFNRKESFWMAPEGTRSKTGTVENFKLGAFYLAIEAKQPIVPICIYGTQFVLPKNSAFTNWGVWKQDVYVHILTPVDAEKQGIDGRYGLRDFVREAIVKEFSHLQASKTFRH
ncbi:MAG: lysophospholipid acyltransferase family protein [Oligoflexia bacterium]|nr:lysophospholipid acyltransferase family protein [Oligoflexia bacterium]